jgi:hypothetical protein
MFNYDGNSHSATPGRSVTGQFLARTHMSKWGRARLAAAIIDEKVRITNLTNKQIAALCGVSIAYVYRLRGGARPKPDQAAQLTKIWDLADPEQRVAFARAAGAERIFDVIAQAIR